LAAFGGLHHLRNRLNDLVEHRSRIGDAPGERFLIIVRLCDDELNLILMSA